MRRATALLRLLAVLAVATLPGGAEAQPTMADFVGVYEGLWFNDTFQSQGPARIRIEVSGQTGTLGVDLGGNVFGGFDPPEVVFTGTVGSQALSKDDDSVFGDVDCTGNPSAFTCTGNMISPSVLSGSIAGGITGDALDSDYELTLFGNQMASGTVTATKLPEADGALAALLACAALARCGRRNARA